MNKIYALLKKYEKYNEKYTFISYLKDFIDRNIFNKKIKNIDNRLIYDMKNHLAKNPLYNENYEMFCMYLNFCPDIEFCKIIDNIIFMKTDSNDIKEVSDKVFLYIRDLREFLAYPKKFIPNIYYYYSPKDKKLKEYKVNGYLNIVITNLIEMEWVEIDTNDIINKN